MTFISAIKHATIGYGIRRPNWQPDLYAYEENGGLYWDDDRAPCDLIAPVMAGVSCISAEDIQANDWEVI